MARVQVCESDEVTDTLRIIAEKYRAESAGDKEMSVSGIASMLAEPGLRVHEAQREKNNRPVIRPSVIKRLAENIVKTQFIVSRLLAMDSLNPYHFWK